MKSVRGGDDGGQRKEKLVAVADLEAMSALTSKWKEVRVSPPAKYFEDSDPATPLPCPFMGCGSELTKRTNFEAHFKVHLTQFRGRLIPSTNGVEDKELSIKYYCPSPGCPYSNTPDNNCNSFPMFKRLKQHYQKVHAPKTFICEGCKKGFATLLFLNTHLRMCGKKFECSCGTSYTSLESLQTHVKRKGHPYDHAKYLELLKAERKLQESAKVSSPSPPVLVKATKVVIPKKKALEGPPPLSPPRSNTAGGGGRKRKTCTATQTQELTVRVSTDTQTSLVTKRARQNKSTAEAGIQAAPSKSHTSYNNSNTNTNTTLQKTTLQPTSQEEDHRHTQTEPDLFFGYPTLSAVDSNDELFSLVTTETQTLDPDDIMTSMLTHPDPFYLETIDNETQTMLDYQFILPF